MTLSPAQWRQSWLDVVRRFYRLEGWHRYAVSFGLGVLTATALAPYYFLPALVIGLSGLVLLTDTATETRRPKWASFATGWAFGFGYFLFGMYWLAFAFLVQADQFAWMIPIAVPAFTGFLGLFFGAACLLATRYWTRNSSRVLIFAVALSLMEFARGTILTGLPWNLIGQSFAGTALLAQAAAWVGPYGLSLIVILLAVAPAASVNRDQSFTNTPLLLMGLGLIALLGASGLRLATGPSETDEGTNLVVVQPNVPQKEKFDPLKSDQHWRRLIESTQKAIPADGTSYIVWPENARGFLAQATDAPQFFADVFAEDAVLVSGTYRTYSDDVRTHYANSAVIFGQSQEGIKPLEAVYDKHHLVPFGEYLPFKGLLKAVGLSQLAPVEDGFTPGAGPMTFDIAGKKMTLLICYEDVFPLALYPRDERPDFLVVMTNDAWFGDDAGPKQHLDISRLRAIESGLPMARSANTGISAIIDSSGQIKSSIPLYEHGFINYKLPVARNRPLYDRIGTPLYALLLLIVASFALRSGLARKG